MHFPELIQDLAIILVVAAIVTFVFKRIRQPVVLGYILAGIIVGPHTPAIFTVTDTENIKVWAELGVIFLMFSLGLEFSFRRLAKVGLSVAVTGVIQIIGMIALGVLSAKLLNWGRMDAVFLGCILAISSTTIIIKALDEFGLRQKKFSELVFGILIVEDLAAILMLVALTNIATTSQVGGVELLVAAMKLAVVVGGWFIVGMFIVPRFVKLVGKHGNDEMLTVVAVGLCLALVALAARLHYSVALGAFIMGSILAESAEVKRIEHLVQPLKDIFGAVFFVSVGMLLDPTAILDNWFAIFIVSLVIIAGKILFVIAGSMVAGQTVRTSVQTGFSMAQIGEFSFIIASLGLAYNVISANVYPVIVASSLITTFTTPYLIRSSGPFADLIERKIPRSLLNTINSYGLWLQRRTLTSERRKFFINGLIKWTLNAVIIIILFTVAEDKLIPIVESNFNVAKKAATGTTWTLAFLLSAPSLYAMLNCFRQPKDKSGTKRAREMSFGSARILSTFLTLSLLGLLSSEYFPVGDTLAVTLTGCVACLILFRKKVGSYYRWLEVQFHSGFQADLSKETRSKTHERLAPWDAHLTEVKVPAGSSIIAKPLQLLGLREKYGLNIVVVSREGLDIVAPKANDLLFPGDKLLCFATDSEIERFRSDLEIEHQKSKNEVLAENYEIRRFKVLKDSAMSKVSIRHSGIRERFDCIVVGIERDGQRTRSPDSTTTLSEGDVLWVVGDSSKLKELLHEFEIKK